MKISKKQTCAFWHLQLQLFQLSSFKLLTLFYTLVNSDLYVENKYSEKFKIKYLYTSIEYSKITQDDLECLATHLALQLAGINE